MRRGLCVALIAALAGCGGGDGAPVPVEQAKQCLTDTEGLKVTGPMGRDPQDTDAPDRTMWATGTDVTAAIGYYDDEARAERAAKEQVEHSKQYEGRVDRHGKLTLIWVRGEGTDEAAAVEECVLS